MVSGLIVLWCWGWRESGVIANKHGVPFWGHENVLKSDSGDGCTIP